MFEKSGHSGADTGLKRAQVTLFIILAIVLVGVIIISFFSAGPRFSFQQQSGLSFENCVVDASKQAITELSKSGGEADPSFYYEYQGTRIPYYCYTNEAYKTCTVQKALVKELFEEEFVTYVKPRVNECYRNSVDELRDRGYDVTAGNIDMNVTVVPHRVNLDIYAPTTIEGQRFTTYKMAFDSELYDVLFVATSILQYETTYGDAPTSELMYYYPHMIVDKVRRGDATKVYVITDKASEDAFQFASKSLVWPAGYDTR